MTDDQTPQNAEDPTPETDAAASRDADTLPYDREAWAAAAPAATAPQDAPRRRVGRPVLIAGAVVLGLGLIGGTAVAATAGDGIPSTPSAAASATPAGPGGTPGEGQCGPGERGPRPGGPGRPDADAATPPAPPADGTARTPPAEGTAPTAPTPGATPPTSGATPGS